MKLCFEIIRDDLGSLVHAMQAEANSTSLTLERPEFYLGENRRFLSGHVYVAPASILPTVPEIEANVLFLIVGGFPPDPYCRQASCLWTEDGEQLLPLFNRLQKIFDRYDAWDAQLMSIIHSTASLQALTDVSLPVFDGAVGISIIDPEYHYLATSMLPPFDITNGSAVDFLSVLPHMQKQDSSCHSTEPFISSSDHICGLHIDVLDEGGFRANLSVSYSEQTPQGKDFILISHLAQRIKEAFSYLPDGPERQGNPLRSLLYHLLSNLPIENEQQRNLLQNNAGHEYVCVKMKPSNRYQRISLNHLCSLIEANFSGSVSFQYDNAIVSFIDCDPPERDETREAQLTEMIRLVSHSAGVSDRFQDLAMAPLYYRQASIVLKAGHILHPECNYFVFSEYALEYMLSNSQGEFPLQMLLTDGIRRLLAHDAESETSYIHTLRTYLNNHMSMTKTAEDLFVHRTTLLARLKRLQEMLQADLDDPDQRLQVQILLKLMETN